MNTKIKFIQGTFQSTEKEANEFCKKKEIIDIKFQEDTDDYITLMIIYKDF
jgi:hypothetical protein